LFSIENQGDGPNVKMNICQFVLKLVKIPIKHR
jgi:hypothetical protein